MLLRACFFILLCAQCTLAKPLLLRSWYSQFGAIVETSITDNCTLEVEQYWSGNRTTPHCLRYHGHNCLIGPAVNCIIGTMTETNKANMASAAIVLGLLPTILALAGSTTTETGILSLRRPLLAILLAAGSPSVNPIRTFEYRSPFEMLKSGNGSVHLDHSKSKCAIYIIILQYIFAGGAAINIFYISRQLSLRTICSFAEETTYLPILWAALAIAIHICGAVAVSWCMRFVDTPKLSTCVGWRSLAHDEFSLSAGRPEKELQLLPGSWKFFLMSWCVSTGTVLHILLGTLIFSSTLFVFTLDAVVIAARYLGSTILCRIVLNYELNGMRDRGENVVEQQDGHEFARTRSDRKDMHSVIEHQAGPRFRIGT